MIIRKIQWQTWDGNKLVIQAITKQVKEENNELIESVSLGSVKYSFVGITTKEQINQIVEDIISGKIK